jgi:natural product precursor
MPEEKKPDELIKELENVEVAELDDRDLEKVSGGAGDCNCSCRSGELPAGDCNCGC